MKWVKVFDSKEAAFNILVNRQPTKVTIGNRKLCAIRIDDQLYAISNYCTHAREELNKGVLNGNNEIVCPLHHYSYRLIDGKESLDRSNDLETFPFEIRTDGVYLGL